MSLFPQLKRFRSFVKLLFTAAGMYWIFIYGFAAAGMLSHDEMTSLRSGQTMIYFILLTIWGIDYMREAKMLRNVIATSADVATATYPVFSGISGRPSSWIMPIINLAGIATSTFLIGRQYGAMIALAFD